MTRRILRAAVATTIVSAIVLGLSGRWTDPWLWTYLSAWAILVVYGLASIKDDLVRERFSPPERGADGAHLRWIRVLGFSHVIIGALDVGRWHLLPVPAELRVVGLAGMAVFGTLIFRAMIANQFFSSVVRIQGERGHRVIDRGPYALVRHPGYLGMMLAMPCSGLALGSWLGVGLATVYAALILRRVTFEDAFLGANLDGYSEYRTRVPYRLLPGVW